MRTFTCRSTFLYAPGLGALCLSSCSHATFAAEQNLADFSSNQNDFSCHIDICDYYPYCRLCHTASGVRDSRGTHILFGRLSDDVKHITQATQVRTPDIQREESRAEEGGRPAGSPTEASAHWGSASKLDRRGNPCTTHAGTLPRRVWGSGQRSRGPQGARQRPALLEGKQRRLLKEKAASAPVL